jgi:site-specific DNA recombinase
MSPTHSNKLGARYRYYVSHALLQNRKAEAGSIARVPAPEIEAFVLDGVRKHLASFDEAERGVAYRDLIERCVDRIVAKPKAIEVRLLLCDADRVSPDGTDQCREDGDRIDHSLPMPTTTITPAWTAPSFAAVKGIVHTPAAKPAMKPDSRDALLAAIVKAPHLTAFPGDAA